MRGSGLKFKFSSQIFLILGAKFRKEIFYLKNLVGKKLVHREEYIPVPSPLKKCSCSAAICQIGPRFVKIGPNPDHFLVQVRTKSGPRGASNPDLSSEIRLLLDFYEYSRLFKPYETCNISLSACKKDHFQGSFFNF